MYGQVLYEDDQLLAFDKPAGLLVVPDRWDRDLANLMQFVQQQYSADVTNVHRLDRETSGVLLCAKNADAARHLAKQFEAHTVEKKYLALVRNGPSEESGLIDLPLAPDTQRLGRNRISRDGKPSATRYQVLERLVAGVNFVAAMPTTGRTHQIRVHLAAIGAPIIGDALYGDGRPLFLSDLKRNFKSKRGQETPLLQRLALHAEELTFEHPASGERVTVCSPLPRDLELALANARKFTKR